MKSLLNSCSRSELSVIPKNWQSSRASIANDWRIFYRFYDPNAPKPVKLVPIKGMNRFKTLAERQEVTRALIENEIHLLDERGYNPITGQFMADQGPAGDISTHTLLIPALRFAEPLLDVVNGTRIDIRSVIRGVEAAASKIYDPENACYLSALPISKLSRKHVKILLEQIGASNPRWSNNRFNIYKSYLSMLFKELIALEVMDANPCREIDSKKKTIKLRAILSPEEEILIDQHLKANHYRFWRFMRLFYDSQARETEMMKLRKDGGVRIGSQEFTVLVKKGKSTREDIRVMSADVVYLWQEVWNEAKPGQFLFSKNLFPGDRSIRPDQIGRRWAKYVKKELGINKDFYSLKHLSTDKMAKDYGLSIASAGAGHTNTNTTSKYYAVGEQNRKREILKGKTVGFGV